MSGPGAAGIDPVKAVASGVYVVTLGPAPSASYDGGRPGYKATRPKPGDRFDRTRARVHKYSRFLRDRQDNVLDRVGDPHVLYRMTTAVDGFAARLDSAQVKQLRSMPGVDLVERSVKQHVAAARMRPLSPVVGAGRDSSAFLGLSGPTGVWARHGGPHHAGRGVVVGVVDTGIWPENPSFAGNPLGPSGRTPDLPGFHGKCDTGQQWTTRDCTHKIVSARYFVKGFGAGRIASSDYLSPRDGIGHGTHVASVAAGDFGTGVRIDGQRFGSISGMAPAARIAVYKACWTAPDPDGDGCTTADVAAAIDRAVRDGVDVLNLSVSGSQNPTDTIARAFLNAAAAGVFVSTAAGNGGPEPGTVEHLAPWVTTVGASTFHRYQGALRLGDGSQYVGAMVSDQTVPSTGLVLGSAVPAPGHSVEQARVCEIGALDAEQAQGQIVVCDRGVVARVDKSTAVARAGGAGMVLVNTTPDSTDADVHAVPTVHLDATAGAAVKAYLAAHPDDATASLDPTGSAPQQVPTIADFSARGGDGAASTGRGSVLKPDLTAPGVSVLGAVSPAADSERLWDLASGTSTSAAHIAGLAAFVAGLHPDWSSAEIKSAMMTTAFDLEANAGPFAEGAGHVDPTRFLDPGLVFDSGPAAWRDFLTGATRARQLNLPSVTVSGLLGTTTVVRRVTNVAATTETYTVTTSGLDGVDVQVRPRTLTLAPGETHRVRIRLTATPNTPADHYTKGWLTWTGLSHQVRVPVAVGAAQVRAPSLMRSLGMSGTLTVEGRSGNGVPVDLTSTGMVPANPTGLSLVPGAFDPSNPTSDADTFETSVQVPTGSDLVRVELSSHNVGDDLDAYLYRGGRPVAADTSTGSSATLTVAAPEPGRYTLYVHAQSAGNHSTTTAQLYTWVLADQGGTSLDLTPDTVGDVPGGSFDYTVSWQGLDPTQRWLGEIRYGDSSRHTLLEIY